MKPIKNYIRQKSSTVKARGKSWQIIYDRDILELSKQFHLTPRDVTIECLKEGIVPSRYVKNLGPISVEEQLKICKTSLLICGCGGIGGALIHMALRVGFGKIRCIDPDKFESSNANRQWFCTTSNEGKTKAKVISDTGKEINPLVEIEAISDKVAEKHLKNIDIVLDGLDSISDRLKLDAWCRKNGLPLIHGAVRGLWGQASTLLPDQKERLDIIYETRDNKSSCNIHDDEDDEYGTMIPIVNTIASVQISEAIKIALGRKPVLKGQFLYIDLENMEYFKVPLESLKK